MTDDATAVLGRDSVMQRVIDERDPYTEPDWTAFERLCIAIVSQRVSTASAAAVRERVFEVLDGVVTPESVLAADEGALREAGLPASKVGYLRNVARAFRREDLTKAGLAGYSDDEVLDRLTEITGVGEWTAETFLIFALGREDVLPLGDLAVRRGIERLYGDADGDGAELTRAEMEEIAEQWRPHRSLATRYIWADYLAE
ncbi:DNA-3-methyladenine glycosylase family protein [Halogeometricum limi]|uniref:DNA-3-methyladenine glycosylase II n=1 Tax=Halogeometricum limi TaxID=555875 RepID=A0A1I6HXN1_9EURY|nr:DNA-3-methyladenine glycosylase II [Halogeometricum limi]